MAGVARRLKSSVAFTISSELNKGLKSVASITRDSVLQTGDFFLLQWSAPQVPGGARVHEMPQEFAKPPQQAAGVRKEKKEKRLEISLRRSRVKKEQQVVHSTSLRRWSRQVVLHPSGSVVQSVRCGSEAARHVPHAHGASGLSLARCLVG